MVKCNQRESHLRLQQRSWSDTLRIKGKENLFFTDTCCAPRATNSANLISSVALCNSAVQPAAAPAKHVVPESSSFRSVVTYAARRHGLPLSSEKSERHEVVVVVQRARVREASLRHANQPAVKGLINGAVPSLVYPVDHLAGSAVGSAIMPQVRVPVLINSPSLRKWIQPTKKITSSSWSARQHSLEVGGCLRAGQRTDGRGCAPVTVSSRSRAAVVGAQGFIYIYILLADPYTLSKRPSPTMTNGP